VRYLKSAVRVVLAVFAVGLMIRSFNIANQSWPRFHHPDLTGPAFSVIIPEHAGPKEIGSRYAAVRAQYAGEEREMGRHGLVVAGCNAAGAIVLLVACFPATWLRYLRKV
jgi:hypothetical protein